MKLSRRNALATLGSSITALGAAACQDTQQPQRVALQPTANESTFGRREVRVMFMGLQLFNVRKPQGEGNWGVTVGMPPVGKDKEGNSTHRAAVTIIGGTVGAPSSGQIEFHAFADGRVSLCFFDGYRLTVSGDHTSKRKLLVQDGPPLQSISTQTPPTPTDWRSMRHLPEFKDQYPGATLKANWQSLADAIVELEEGELMATPGFQCTSPVFGRSVLSLISMWSAPANDKLTLKFARLDGSGTVDVPVTIDSTGPFLLLQTYVPTGKMTGPHLSSFELFFDNLPKASTQPVTNYAAAPAAMSQTAASQRLRSSTVAMIPDVHTAQAQAQASQPQSQSQIRVQAEEALVSILDFLKQNDGSILCPPQTFGF